VIERIADRDLDRLAKRLGKACLEREVAVATAESCTGGGTAEAITRVAGSSAWFDRGFVTYSNAAKEEMLGVSKESLASHGAVSEEVACAMAAGALNRSNADVSVAITGIAGPGGAMPGKPVGLVWFAWGVRGGEVQSRAMRFKGDRVRVRRQAMAVALQGLIDLVG
jgi:nicotinamide-nucleotide amidase